MRKINSANYENELSITDGCPLTAAVNMLSGRWKLVILWQVADKRARYKVLKRAIPGISDQMLARQLRRLQSDGFLRKEIFAEVPVRTEYRLTPLGESLIPVLGQLLDWGRDNKIAERYAAQLPG